MAHHSAFVLSLSMSAVLSVCFFGGTSTAQQSDSNTQSAVIAPAYDASSCRRVLNAAISSFKQGDMDMALTLTKQGLTNCPNDLSMHELRALVLFAKGDYHEASTSLHVVLKNGQVWNWGTMIRMYPSSDGYTQQLRSLEAYTRKHPDDGASRFVQAYHYMVMGFPDAAARELQMVIRLEADDRIASEVLKSVSRLPGVVLR